MPQATTYAELRAMPREELIRLYDTTTPNTHLWLDFYRAEIARRDADEQTAKIVAMTEQMRAMTWVIVVLTAVNALAALAAVLRP